MRMFLALPVYGHCAMTLNDFFFVNTRCELIEITMRDLAIPRFEETAALVEAPAGLEQPLGALEQRAPGEFPLECFVQPQAALERLQTASIQTLTDLDTERPSHDR